MEISNGVAIAALWQRLLLKFGSPSSRIAATWRGFPKRPPAAGIDQRPLRDSAELRRARLDWYLSVQGAGSPLGMMVRTLRIGEFAW